MVIGSTADTIDSHADQAPDKNIASEAGSATEASSFCKAITCGS